jgi:hypothetical protein
MHSLREVVDFTGVAGPAGQLEGEGTRPLGLGAGGGLVAAVVPADQRHSLRALCAALPTLPPIALTARITAHDDVVAPSRPIIEVDPPAGAVVETVVNFFSGGAVASPTSTARRFLDGQEVAGTIFAAALFAEPGAYEAVVRRVGVTSVGVVTLEQRLPFRVRAVPAPSPPAPPPTPTPGPPPRPAAGPTCGVELDSRTGGTSNVRVFGGGFPAGSAVDVREDGAFGTSTVTDGLGSYSVIIGVLEANPPVTHRFQAVSGGASSNEAGFTV